MIGMDAASTTHDQSQRTAEELALAEQQLRLRRAQADLRLLEGWLDSEFGGVDVWYDLRSGGSSTGARVPPDAPGDRRSGRNWPIWQSDVELNDYRAQSRAVCTANSQARGAITQLTNHVIGSGFDYRIELSESVRDQSEKPGFQPPPEMDSLAKSVQQIIDEFMARSSWNAKVDMRHARTIGNREREIYRRVIRDFEVFLRFYGMDDGRTSVRFVNPSQLRNPPGGSEPNGWSFGIQHQTDPFHDVEDIVAYGIYDPTTSQVEVVPADQILHIKNPYTDSDVKRGDPVVAFDQLNSFIRAAKLQNCISIGSAVRAATAEIWKHSTGTPTQIANLANSRVTSQRSDPVSGVTYKQQRFEPGAVRHVPQGMEPVAHPGSAGAPDHEQVVQADLRTALSPFCAPEYFTGDASNANYASTKESGNPFVKHAQAEQSFFKAAFSAVMWRVVKNAIAGGKLPEDLGGYSTIDLITIRITEPDPVAKNPLERAQVDSILVNQLQVKDRQTTAGEWGIDYAKAKANNDQYAEEQGTMGMLGGMGGMQ